MNDSAASADKSPVRSTTAASFGLSDSFLAILVCPIDHGPLSVTPGGLKCDICSRVFPVENGIPNFVVDE
jgi:uncharacterized protein YbaR (Trm112 family)